MTGQDLPAWLPPAFYRSRRNEQCHKCNMTCSLHDVDEQLPEVRHRPQVQCKTVSEITIEIIGLQASNAKTKETVETTTTKFKLSFTRMPSTVLAPGHFWVAASCVPAGCHCCHGRLGACPSGASAIPEATRLGNLVLDLTINIWVWLEIFRTALRLPAVPRPQGWDPTGCRFWWWRAAYCSAGIPNVGKTNHQFLDEYCIYNYIYIFNIHTCATYLCIHDMSMHTIIVQDVESLGCSTILSWGMTPKLNDDLLSRIWLLKRPLGPVGGFDFLWRWGGAGA